MRFVCTGGKRTIQKGLTRTGCGGQSECESPNVLLRALGVDEGKERPVQRSQTQQRDRKREKWKVHVLIVGGKKGSGQRKALAVCVGRGAAKRLSGVIFDVGQNHLHNLSISREEAR